jgi:hypothetical protein
MSFSHTTRAGTAIGVATGSGAAAAAASNSAFVRVSPANAWRRSSSSRRSAGVLSSISM